MLDGRVGAWRGRAFGRAGGRANDNARDDAALGVAVTAGAGSRERGEREGGKETS